MTTRPTHTRRTLLTMAALFIVTTVSANFAFANPNEVSVEKRPETKTVDIKICDKLFTTLHYGTEVKKPYLYPVYAQGQAQVVRKLRLDVKTTRNKDYDHIHHKGIWISVDEVNDHKHWAEKQKIVNVSVNVQPTSDGTQVLVVKNKWLDDAEKPILIETTKMTFHPNRLIEFEISLAPAGKEVTIGDTKEGLLGIRLAQSMREKVGGTIKNSDGQVSEKNCWGQNATWVDYYGKVDNKTYGIALFDHPSNERKSRYHTRGYGLFTISPFGESAYTKEKNPAKPVHLKRGQSYDIKYGLYVHTGTTEEAKVKEVFEKFTKASTKKK